jgi:hypothetical protein
MAAACFWSADSLLALAVDACHGGLGADAAVEFDWTAPFDDPVVDAPERVPYQLTITDESNEIVKVGTFCRVQTTSLSLCGKLRINLK